MRTTTKHGWNVSSLLVAIQVMWLTPRQKVAYVIFFKATNAVGYKSEIRDSRYLSFVKRQAGKTSCTDSLAECVIAIGMKASVLNVE